MSFLKSILCKEFNAENFASITCVWTELKVTARSSFIQYHTYFFSWECRGDRSPRKTQNTSQFLSNSGTSAGFTPRLDQARPEMKLHHLVFGRPLGRPCLGVANRTRLIDFSWDILDTRPKYRSWNFSNTEKWIDIQDFTDFTAAHFVAKCKRREFFAKIPSLPLIPEIALFQLLLKIHDYYRWGSEQRLI